MNSEASLKALLQTCAQSLVIDIQAYWEMLENFL